MSFKGQESVSLRFHFAIALGLVSVHDRLQHAGRWDRVSWIRLPHLQYLFFACLRVVDFSILLFRLESFPNGKGGLS
jgi:hypothetical protein